MVKNVGFFGMLHQIYNAIGALASATHRGANALDNLGEWAEVKTKAFTDEAKLDIEEDLIDRRLQRAERRKERQLALGTDAQVTDVQPRIEGAAS